MKLKENILYEIHTQDPDNYDAGYYLAQDEQYLLFNSINVDGLDDGFLLIKKESVKHAEYETKYCDKLRKLSEFHNTAKRKNEFQSDKLMKQLLKYAKEAQSIVAIELQDSEKTDLFGFIFDYDEEYVYITEIDCYGLIDGKSVSKISDISSITIDEHYHSRYKILYSLNYNKSSE